MASQPPQESSLAGLSPKDFRLFVQDILGHIKKVEVIDRKTLRELAFDKRQMEDQQIAPILGLAFNQAIDYLAAQGCIYLDNGKSRNNLVFIKDLPRGLPTPNIPLLNGQLPNTR